MHRPPASWKWTKPSPKAHSDQPRKRKNAAARLCFHESRKYNHFLPPISASLGKNILYEALDIVCFYHFEYRGKAAFLMPVNAVVAADAVAVGWALAHRLPAGQSLLIEQSPLFKGFKRKSSAIFGEAAINPPLARSATYAMAEGCKMLRVIGGLKPTLRRLGCCCRTQSTYY